MKQIQIFLSFAFMGYSCSVQQKADLEKLTFFKEYPRVVVKDRKESTGRSESLTSLPAYTTFEYCGIQFWVFGTTGTLF
jgi:hypothetical protein